jgi:hypothetical protein
VLRDREAVSGISIRHCEEHLRRSNPLFRGVSDGIEKLRRTGSPAFAGDDGF